MKFIVSDLSEYADAVTALLAHWQATVIKGNASEIGALAESSEVCTLLTPEQATDGGSGVQSRSGFGVVGLHRPGLRRESLGDETRCAGPRLRILGGLTCGQRLSSF